MRSVMARRAFPGLIGVALAMQAGLAGAAPAPTGLSPAGAWLVERIAGRAVADHPQTTMDITADGAVSGSGGCNRYFGHARLSAGRIVFGALASTRRACKPATIMAQEQRFHQTLAKVARYRSEPARQRLVLLGADGSELVVLTVRP